MREVLEYPGGPVACDLSHVTASKAVKRFRREIGREPTILFVSVKDRDLGLRLAPSLGLRSATYTTYEDDSWSVGDEQDKGFGSVGA